MSRDRFCAGMRMTRFQFNTLDAEGGALPHSLRTLVRDSYVGLPLLPISVELDYARYLGTNPAAVTLWPTRGLRGAGGVRLSLPWRERALRNLLVYIVRQRVMISPSRKARTRRAQAKPMTPEEADRLYAEQVRLW